MIMFYCEILQPQLIGRLLCIICLTISITMRCSRVNIITVYKQVVKWTDVCSFQHCHRPTRTLVGRVNKNATRQSDLVQLRKGRARTAPVKGRGRYKAFTARIMLRTTFLVIACLSFCTIDSDIINHNSMIHWGWHVAWY